MFFGVETCALSEFTIIACYNYEGYDNLQELCDEHTHHLVTGSLGTCFTQFDPVYDHAVLDQVQDAIIFVSDGIDEAETLLLDIHAIISLD